ncbi:hypothetical protein ACFQMA_14720 [Halosimplex aquaticum]|uniref:DUF8001 domain-containing protein n=1 Tax=Halosimplex aquaticum TaxID=3026162 RepID=A0ABD5Y173_9EURY|nr:hypothetical protein [Halosimplex aquaticum]
MTDPPVVAAGELDADELLARIVDEGRVRVRTEFLDAEHDVVLRWDGDVFYCDTPTRLHRHDSESEMRTCLEKQGYAR